MNITIHEYLRTLTVQETELKLEELIFTSETLMLNVIKSYSLVFTSRANSRFCFFNSKSKRIEQTKCSRKSGSVCFAMHSYIHNIGQYKKYKFFVIGEIQKMIPCNSTTAKYFNPKQKLYKLTFKGIHSENCSRQNMQIILNRKQNETNLVAQTLQQCEKYLKDCIFYKITYVW
ncbi:Hypothetical_protein [Hexamita inflata]|uniref:Hypothetical_protein n=1 Tax=Hexamita inflata TaxID=28002 RepID=A0AA86UQD1_9EUKA|nr:Hypothetical protein HINF_LOCUS48046 [Hexamita inflata]